MQGLETPSINQNKNKQTKKIIQKSLAVIIHLQLLGQVEVLGPSTPFPTAGGSSALTAQQEEGCVQ